MNLRFWKRNNTAAAKDIATELNNIKINWLNARRDLGLEDASYVTSPVTIPSSRTVTRIRQAVKGFVSQIFRGTFQPPEWNFNDIANALKTESILRRAIEKYVEQIWKNNYEFKGKNTNTVKYIRKRMRQISQVSGISTFQLFQKIAFSLVAYNNVIIAKKRNVRASGGKPRVTFDGKHLDPVAAYFVVSPATIMVDKDEYGVVKKWKQSLPHRYLSSNKTPEWHPDNIIFFKDSSATDSQYFFAMPMGIPVLADIKALRETEELSMLQAIKFSIPRYHAKVGEPNKPGVQEEINNTASYIDTLPSDAVIVTSNRIDIGSISSNDQIMDLSPYLKYWTQRILSGLGMSGVSMGDGSTANRATAQTMASEMQNTTIKYQQLIKDAIETHIIRELLYELGYTEETLTEENMVYLHIPEIDLDNKIKKENHALQLFMGNAITHSELRNELGKDTLSKSEIKELYAFMITEALSASAAKNANNSTLKQVDNKDRPANQHGTQNAKPNVTKDVEEVRQLFQDFISTIPGESGQD